MTTLVNFEVGQKYKNRKGTFEVLAIDGDVMHISWKNGKEVATTVTLQSRIIEHIQHEIEELAFLKAKVASPGKRSRAAV
jgi:hypothetical protein